ncbi:MAG: 23S rRNA (guanosine(2251)-2'-O)-methyltransferase RlmB [Pseudomonadota bacterium]|nr:23S rRNA (guanosine(2251)-2'-O)-methyltransferase RlmB [Pseudomonadota bacterium]
MTGPTGLFCGFHAAENALRSGSSADQLLYDGRREDARLVSLLELADRKGVSARLVGRQELDHLAGGVRHQGVIVLSTRRAAPSTVSLVGCLDALPEPPLLLVLDAIQDPHNLGACLRSAAAAAVHGVILPRHKGCSLTPAAVRVAAGGVSHLQVFEESNWSRVLQTLKKRGLWLVGTDESADQAIYDIDLTEPVAIIVGSEDAGLRPVTRNQCDRFARIPSPGLIGSLNVSVATGIVLFEALRQRAADQPGLAGS